MCARTTKLCALTFQIFRYLKWITDSKEAVEDSFVKSYHRYNRNAIVRYKVYLNVENVYKYTELSTYAVFPPICAMVGNVISAAILAIANPADIGTSGT